jgi:hypothetical protein
LSNCKRNNQVNFWPLVSKCICYMNSEYLTKLGPLCRHKFNYPNGSPPKLIIQRGLVNTSVATTWAQQKSIELISVWCKMSNINLINTWSQIKNKYLIRVLHENCIQIQKYVSKVRRVEIFYLCYPTQISIQYISLIYLIVI